MTLVCSGAGHVKRYKLGCSDWYTNWCIYFVILCVLWLSHPHVWLVFGSNMSSEFMLLAMLYPKTLTHGPTRCMYLCCLIDTRISYHIMPYARSCCDDGEWQITYCRSLRVKMDGFMQDANSYPSKLAKEAFGGAFTVWPSSSTKFVVMVVKRCYEWHTDQGLCNRKWSFHSNIWIYW